MIDVLTIGIAVTAVASIVWVVIGMSANHRAFNATMHKLRDLIS